MPIYQNQLHHGAFVPGEYGSTPLGSLNDGPALQAAHDAMPAEGGTMFLPAGTFNVNTPVVFSKPVKLIGHGQESAYERNGTVLSTTLANFPAIPANPGAFITGATGPMLYVTSPGCTVEDIGFRNNNSNVGNSRGFVVDIRRPHPNPVLNGALVGDSFHMNRVSANGFHVCYDVINAFEWTMIGCQSQNSRFAGVRLASAALPDGGDGYMAGCQILCGRYTGGHGVYQTSGGGLKMLGNKINAGRHANGGHFDYNYRFVGDYSQAIPGSTAGTSVLVIVGNSFEAAVNGIVIGDGNGIGINLLTITGNEIACGANDGLVGEGVWLRNCNEGVVSSNIFLTSSAGVLGYNNALRLSGSPRITHGLNHNTGIGASLLVE